MRFTILSHAGMLVETKGTKLILDPWLLGSCYWRSWWNYPTPPDLTGRLDDLDYVYLTHHHWDHFHGPSLRTLPKSATLLIPRAHSPRLVRELEPFGFKRIVELPHGETRALADGLRVTSYHFGVALDSTLVVDDGEVTLMDMNDCKLTGLPLRQVLGRHPRVDFLFRSHSSASAYPHCIVAEDPRELRYRSNEDYVTEFVNTARIVKPRYAIPFASNHCFVHRETFRFNDTAVSPLDVKRHFDGHRPPESECVVMVAGDSWDDRAGFALQEHTYFTERERHLRELTEELAPSLEEHYRREDRVRVPFASFAAYFGELLLALPRILRLVFRPVVAFELTTPGSPAWVVDFDRRRVYEAPGVPPAATVTIRTHPAVLRDCVEKRMFSVFTASKRLSVEIKRGALKDFFLLTQVLDMFEYGYFPLWRNLNPRFAAAWLRRWREVLLYAQLVGRMLLRRRGGDPLSEAIPRIS